MSKKVWLTFEEAAREFGKTKFRMRAIAKEKFANDETKMKMVTIKRGKGSYQRWEVKRSAYEEYERTKGGAKDGRKAYLVRVNEVELAALQEYCKENKLAIEPRYKRKTQ
jgi:hypothetical protein